jgi:hypothetical protein
MAHSLHFCMYSAYFCVVTRSEACLYDLEPKEVQGCVILVSLPSNKLVGHADHGGHVFCSKNTPAVLEYLLAVQGSDLMCSRKRA